MTEILITLTLAALCVFGSAAITRAEERERWKLWALRGMRGKAPDGTRYRRKWQHLLPEDDQ